MKIFSKDNPSRPLIIVCLSYTIVCYALFFIACFLPTPSWGPSLMAWLAPVIQSIDVAAQVGALKGHDPFPIQVVILYCVLGSAAIMSCWTYSAYFNERNRNEWFEHISIVMKERNRSRFKLFLIGVFGIAIGIFLPYIVFFVGTDSVDWWQTISLYSPTLIATTYFLGVSFILSFSGLGCGYIYMTFSKHLKNYKWMH